MTKQQLTLCFLLATGVVTADLNAIRTLTVEQGQNVRRPIEEQIFSKPKDKLPAIEKELLDIFKAKDTTLEGKRYTCRMLRFSASEACVPILAPELLNPELSHYVRLVFQGLDSASVDPALMAALVQAPDTLKPGMIQTLGQRKCLAAVKVIEPLLKNPTQDIQYASIKALGRIGGKDAVAALAKASVKPEFTRDLRQAEMQAAADLDTGAALKVYAKYMNDGDNELRCTAMVGLAKTDPAAAVPGVLTLLDSSDKRIQDATTGLLKLLPADKLAASLPKLSTAQQLKVIHALAERNETSAETAILALADSGDDDVSRASIKALGQVGTAASAPFLMDRMIDDKTAFASLCRVKGIDSALLEALKKEEHELKAVKLIECLAERRAPEALPFFMELAAGDWSRKSAAAISGLGRLISESDFYACAELILKSSDLKKIKAVEKMMVSAAQYQRNRPACAAATAKAFPNADGEAKYALIRALGAMGGKEANRILSEAMAGDDPKARDAAIRGLCNSPNPAVADQLLKLAETSDDETYKVLALRGYIRMANTYSDAKTIFPMCEKAAALTDRPAELKSIIACVKRVKEPRSVKLIASMLETEGMVNDCGWALIELSRNWKARPACLEPLKKVAELTTDQNLANAAQERIKVIEAEKKK